MPDVEHIHGDPHFAQTIEDALRGRQFDVVLAVYGRIRFQAEVLAGRCERFIAVGGFPVYAGFRDPAASRPYGMKLLANEASPIVTEDAGSDAARASYKIYQTQRRVFDLHDGGAFQATYFRYPLIYGPRQGGPLHEWPVVRRVLDRREHIIMPDGGLTIMTRCAAENAAHCVLLAVDQPEVAAGQIYNCADDEQYSYRQWMELIVDYMGGSLKMLSMPEVLAKPGWCLSPQYLDAHRIVDATKANLELGYHDVVSPREALHQTVDWLIAHPVTIAEYPALRDRFDYQAEDRLISAYLRCVEEVQREAPFEVTEMFHMYPHPKEPHSLRDHRGR
ncbi:MAG: epimerase [Dehalococcoidia bacterium]